MAANDAELKITASLDDQVTAAVKKLVDEVRDFAKEAKKAFDGIGDSIEKAKANLEKTGTEAKKTKEDVKKVGDEGAKGFDKLDDKIKGVTLSFVSFGTAVAVLRQSLLDTLTVAEEVDVINARIKNLADVSGEAFTQLSEDLRTFSLANKTLVKDQEVSLAALKLLKEGFSTTDTVLVDLAESFNFARLTGASLTDATNLLTEANKALGDGTNNSVEIFSRLNLLFKKDFDNANALSGALAALSNTARQSGLSLDDATVSLATLAETTSAGEALRSLETILKTLQARAGEVDSFFAATGKRFDETTVKTAGLRNTLVALLDGIAASGGDAQTELKKLFGSQDAVNSVLALGSKEGKAYVESVKALSSSLRTLNADTDTVKAASKGLVNFVATDFLDVFDNVGVVIRGVDGSTEDLARRIIQLRKANEEGARSVTISTKDIADAIGGIGGAAAELGKVALPQLAEGIDEVGKAAKVSVADVDAWFSTISGQEVDADLQRINKQIETLIIRANAFGEAGIEGFQGEELQARLAEIAAFEQLLIDELFLDRKKKEEELLADKSRKAEEAAAIEARENEKLRLQKQQIDKEEFDRRIRQAQELNALSSQLLNESLTRGSAFFADLQNQIKPLAAEIQLYEGLIANNLLSDEDLAGINGRIQTLRAGIEQLTVTSVQSGEALRAGFAETINNEVKDSLNAFQQGVTLAQSITSGFTNSIAGLFNDLVLGSKNAKEAFGNFIKSLISAVVQAINQIIAMKIALSIIGFVTGAASTAGAVDVSSSAANASASSAGVFAAKGGVVAGSMGRPAGLPVNAYAQGGVARSPQVAIFGEGKGAEAFVPLPGPNRGIPVEFKSMPSGGNIVVNFSPNISALDGASVRDLLVREGKVIGDIVASEIATGSNRGLTDIVRGRA